MDRRICLPTRMNFARNSVHPLSINCQDIRKQQSLLRAPIPRGINATTSRGVHSYLPWIHRTAVALVVRYVLVEYYVTHRIYPDKIAVADVQVEPAVMNTPYGNCIKMDPFVILRALAISLELGIIVTIKFWDATVPSPRGYRNAQWRPGTIVYVGTHEDGRQETLFIANQ